MNNLPYLMIAGCCVCATLSLPRSLLAAPPSAASEPRTVRLEVDVEDLGDKGIGLDQTVREQLSPPLEQADFALATTTDDETDVTLRVRFRALESGDYDYGVHFEFIDEAGSEPAIEWVDCHMCVDARLMPMLADQTPALLAALAARVAETVQVPAPVPVLVRERVVASDDAAAEGVAVEAIADAGPEPRPITGLGIGGTVVAGLGIGALIWGGVELSRGVVVEDARGLQIVSVDHRPAGYALVASGTTALVGGVILLAVDLARQAKRRDQARAGHARFYPLLTPSHAGFGVTGEF